MRKKVNLNAFKQITHSKHQLRSKQYSIQYLSKLYTSIRISIELQKKAGHLEDT